MPETPDGSVRLALGEYPLGTTVAHRDFPDIKWRVVKQVTGDDGQVETVTLQRVGGKFNKTVVDASANCRQYIAESGRSLSRKLARAVQAAAAKAATTVSDPVVEDAGVAVAPVVPDVKPRVDKPKPSAPKQPVKRRAPATTKPNAKAAGGGSASQVRGIPTVPISEVKLDHRNPFEYKGRMHGYFQAFLDGGGKATYGDLMRSCVRLSDEFGIQDKEKAIQRDLNNQTWNWQQGKWGLLVTKDDSMCQKTAGGHPVKGDRDRVVFTCVEVQGVPWSDAVAAKRA